MPILVKEVLSAAANLVAREDLVAAIEKGGEADGELALLVRCFNLVENEVALDYFPLKKREHFTPEEGKILYSRFAEAPIDILCVKSYLGMGIPFELFPDAICLKNNVKDAEVTYAYVPRQKTLEQVSDFRGKVSVRLLALGVASQFLLAQARYAEAATFEKKFREAIRAANVVRHKLAIRARRWA